MKKSVVLFTLLLGMGCFLAALHTHRKLIALRAKAAPPAAATNDRPSAPLRPRELKSAAPKAERPPQAPPMTAEEKQHAYDRLWENPEFVALMVRKLRWELQPRYANLFRALALSPTQSESLMRLLVERQIAEGDSLRIARERGLSSVQTAKLRELAQAPIDQEIGRLLDERGFEKFRHYEQTAPLRARVQEFASRLDANNAPLPPERIEQLVDAMLPLIPPQPGGGYAPITAFPPELLEHARTVLSSDQMIILQQFQVEKTALAEMAKTVRAAGLDRVAAQTPPTSEK